MIRIEVDPLELRAASRIAQNAGARSIRIRNVSFDSTAFEKTAPNADVSIRFRWEFEPHRQPEPGLLIAGVQLFVSVAQQGDNEEASPGNEEASNEPDSVVNVGLRCEVVYDIPIGPVPEELEKMGGLEAFSKWNALYHCWPYFRQETSRLCAGASLGWVPPLPLIMLVSKNVEKPSPSGDPE